MRVPRRFLHIEEPCGIKSYMFKEEIFKKLGIAETVFPFSACMLSRGKLVVSGVKRILSATECEITLRLRPDILTVTGEGLKIVEIGGEDVCIEGRIGGLNFEDGK